MHELNKTDLDRSWGGTQLPVMAFGSGQLACGDLREPLYMNQAARDLFPQGLPELPEEELEELLSALRECRASPALRLWEGLYSASAVAQGELTACLLTPLDEAYNEMQRALDQAVAANQAKTSFLSEMSHDIRTPMGAIVGLVAIARAQEGAPAKVRECLEKIQTASGHMMSLLNEVLDISRIESGRVHLQPEQANVADLLHELLIVAKPQADSAGVGFRLEMGRVCREELVLDPVRLKQVCLNLLSNAIKYTQRGGQVDFSFSVEPGNGPDMVFMRIQVKDNGIGMSREFLLKLFSPFEREERSVVNKIQGTGLGMAITKSLVELMGGEIAVESELGKGSCFTLGVPFPVGDVKEDAFTDLAGRRVLLLDGDQRQGALAMQMLAETGLVADWAKNAADAVMYINDADLDNRPYYALLTADNLPDAEATLLLPQLRQRLEETTRILLLTSDDWSQIEYIYTRSGVDGHIPLPLFRSRLAAGLRERPLDADLDAPSAADLSGRRLLLAEDNELNREIAQELIGESGAIIDCAADGREAVEMFERSAPGYYSAVLMDVQMPVMNGLDAARALRKLERPDAASVPIIAMTANAFIEDVRASLEAGMNAHLSKPLDMDKVFSVLEELTGRASG